MASCKTAGLEIKKIFRPPFGDKLEKCSRQVQIFSRQFVWCKWSSSQYQLGFWYSARSLSREFQVNLQNPVKFTIMCEIPWNSREILSNTCRHNIFETYFGYWGCLIAETLQIYLETSSPQCAKNVSKLPGVNYVAKHWALVMMLKALPLAHFSSALLLEYVRLSLLKTLHTVVKSVQNQSISSEICPENSHEIGCFSAKLAVKISAKSVSENPVKFYFRDLDRTILQGFWYQIWSFKNIADRSRYKFGDKLALFIRFSTFCMTKAKQEKMKFLFQQTLLF